MRTRRKIFVDSKYYRKEISTKTSILWVSDSGRDYALSVRIDKNNTVSASMR